MRRLLFLTALLAGCADRELVANNPDFAATPDLGSKPDLAPNPFVATDVTLQAVTSDGWAIVRQGNDGAFDAVFLADWSWREILPAGAVGSDVSAGASGKTVILTNWLDRTPWHLWTADGGTRASPAGDDLFLHDVSSDGKLLYHLGDQLILEEIASQTTRVIATGKAGKPLAFYDTFYGQEIIGPFGPDQWVTEIDPTSGDLTGLFGGTLNPYFTTDHPQAQRLITTDGSGLCWVIPLNGLEPQSFGSGGARFCDFNRDGSAILEESLAGALLQINLDGKQTVIQNGPAFYEGLSPDQSALMLATNGATSHFLARFTPNATPTHIVDGQSFALGVSTFTADSRFALLAIGTDRPIPSVLYAAAVADGSVTTVAQGVGRYQTLDGSRLLVWDHVDPITQAGDLELFDLAQPSSAPKRLASGVVWPFLTTPDEKSVLYTQPGVGLSIAGL